MKKLLAALLVCLMAFTVIACDEPGEPSAFDPFIYAIDQTPSSKIKIVSELSTSLGVLHATVETTFKTDGGASIAYSVENFSSDFQNNDIVEVHNGTVTLNKDGSYSDGAFRGVVGENPVKIEFNFDSSKFESYNVTESVLSGTVKASNTASVFGVEFDSDVAFMLTINNGKVISLTLTQILS